MVMAVSGRTYDSRGLICRSIDVIAADDSSCIGDAIASLYVEDLRASEDRVS